MSWLLILSIVFLGVGVLAFIITRNAFRNPPPVALPMEKSSGAATINTMMREDIPAPPPSHPATLLSGQNGKEADVLADTLARVRENPILPTAPKAYLRLEEHNDELERLLIRRSQRQGGANTAPAPREFSIGVTEEKAAPPAPGKKSFPGNKRS